MNRSSIILVFMAIFVALSTSTVSGDSPIDKARAIISLDGDIRECDSMLEALHHLQATHKGDYDPTKGSWYTYRISVTAHSIFYRMSDIGIDTDALLESWIDIVQRRKCQLIAELNRISCD